MIELIKPLGLVIPLWKEFILIPVMGYIDPNTGGMLFQILAVVFATLSGFFLIFSGQIKRAYYKMRRRINNPDTEESQEPDRNKENE